MTSHHILDSEAYWPKWGGDLRNTNRSPFIAGKEMWTAKQDYPHLGIGPPVIDKNGDLYFNGGPFGLIKYAKDFETIWEIPGIFGKGGLSSTSPVLMENTESGQKLVVSTLQDSDGYHKIRAYDQETGAIVWSYISHAITSSTDYAAGLGIDADGDLYFGTGDSGILTAIHGNGSLKWQVDDSIPYPAGAKSRHIGYPSVWESVIYYYVNFYEANLYYMAYSTTDGSRLWDHLTGDTYYNARARGVRIADDGTVYFSNALNTNRISAYNPDFSLKWVAAPGGDPTDCYIAAIAKDGTIYGGQLQILLSLFALDPVDGSTIWSRGDHRGRVIVDRTGDLVGQDSIGPYYVWAIGANGIQKGWCNSDSLSVEFPVIAPNGDLYDGSARIYTAEERAIRLKRGISEHLINTAPITAGNRVAMIKRGERRETFKTDTIAAGDRVKRITVGGKTILQKHYIAPNAFWHSTL